MNLGIVGHAKEKFTPRTQVAAKRAIVRAISEARAQSGEWPTIVSGRSPLGGVDVWAENIARALGLKTLIFPPRVHRWSGPGGFRERNLEIARHSDLVLVVVVRRLPPGYSGGIAFERCYHCARAGAPADHVKSGGCWTAHWAKAARWVVI